MAPRSVIPPRPWNVPSPTAHPDERAVRFSPHDAALNGWTEDESTYLRLDVDDEPEEPEACL